MTLGKGFGEDGEREGKGLETIFYSKKIKEHSQLSLIKKLVKDLI